MRFLFVMICFLWPQISFASGHSNGAHPFAKAMEAVQSQDWPAAMNLAQKSGPLGTDLVLWHQLRAGDGQFSDTLAFLDRRFDWPGLKLLRKRSESTIPANAHPKDISGFFGGQFPQTLQGALRLAQAHRAMGQESLANQVIRAAWAHLPILEDQADIDQQILAAFGASLRDLHAKRVDALLWAGHISSAKAMLPYLPDDHAALAQARITVQEDTEGLQAKINAVPNHLSADPGLAYDRFEWRLRKGRYDAAITLISKRSAGLHNLGQPDKWAKGRMRLARDLMWDGNWRAAYRMASNHHMIGGADYASLEWLSGFIALRKLGDASAALKHFQTHESQVSSPISLARTHYWQGRAHKALGQSQFANASFAKGAEYQTAFYGLLSAEELGLDLDPNLTGRESFPIDLNLPVFANSNYAAAQLLFDAGYERLSIRFLTHLAETQNRPTIAAMAAIEGAKVRPHFELLLAKRAAQYGMVLHRPYFPTHPLAEETGGIPPEFALAIARRESEFFVDARSRVGARGLMQLMPGTAKDMAVKIGVPYDLPMLTEDGVYNARLGVAYLEELKDKFGYSPVQIAAGYNAGPSRPERWMQKLGDPRKGDIDVIDWIEQIPFSETRNYVMRVTESLPAYQARLSGRTGKVAFRALLNGRYVPPPPPLAPARSLRPVARTALSIR
ncbi:MAG: lytic transglycosylase domain-containing protein [Planktomarina sp.]